MLGAILLQLAVSVCLLLAVVPEFHIDYSLSLIVLILLRDYILSDWKVSRIQGSMKSPEEIDYVLGNCSQLVRFGCLMR